jgi:hypothetical protein
VFQAAAEVVAQVADQAAGKGQFYTVGQAAWPSCARPRRRCRNGRLIGLRLQVLQRPGAEQVEAAAFGAGAGAVEQDRTGRLRRRAK